MKLSEPGMVFVIYSRHLYAFICIYSLFLLQKCCRVCLCVLLRACIIN